MSASDRLALRLNRGALITWTIAFAALGLVFGYLTTSITSILGLALGFTGFRRRDLAR